MLLTESGLNTITDWTYPTYDDSVGYEPIKTIQPKNHKVKTRRKLIRKIRTTKNILYE